MKANNTTSTGCPFCGTGCALSIECGENGFKVKGDKTNPSTQGDLCFKPIQMAKALDAHRLSAPLYRADKSKPFQEISWDEAIALLAHNISSLPKDALYFYLSGQLLTEESYLFTKLIKGYLGTNNVDANSRLCMATAVVAHKMAFGSDGPVGNYADIDDADAIIISGSNPAWAHPVIFRRILARKKAHPETKIIVIDPIYTETAEKSDLWMGLSGGSDTTLYNALLAELYRRGACDTAFIDRATEGFEQTLNAAIEIPFAESVASCGLPLNDVETLVELFASDKKILGLWCQGLNQAQDGVMRNLGFINLFLATGRLNVQKGLPLSLTGQPNAMGGREVGYLSNALPGYRDVRNSDDRATCEVYWNLPPDTISPTPGITVTDAIDAMSANQIRFLWVACTNPLLTLPDVKKTEKAFSNPELFLVVQDCVLSETALLANLVLPTLSWGEKEGSMTNSERFIKRVRPFKSGPAGAKSDSEIICGLAQKLGFLGFDYTGAEAIYNEYKALTKNRFCDQSSQEYDSLSYQWGGERLYANEHFATPTFKAQFHPIISSASHPDKNQFVLITGRTKKQWHTMTRTGHVAELMKEEEHPYLVMNSNEAEERGIYEGDSVVITNQLGSLELPVRFGKLAPNHLFAPFGYPETPINTLVPVTNDPFSFQSALKSAHVRVTRKPINCH
ncbi:molybdopterin-dependent oxidoreductase [Sulfuricurvum sp.]|uniref:molybdopterin oxidoreductase family protein n=1 Tax=Sulfuricurvum sp. TaxID=2025608 RepID=UPI0026358ED3|nr:molybdopterin-dependent oxidoreductase [Sulfuricurvum sp.]MDD2267883.1 molybdopterin-dependent oxidoreductase [Sulfuricurvum sp.]MDD2784923.1 molybdopterin-dependent oxidoreductase [Sulfuricurvum sp.]